MLCFAWYRSIHTRISYMYLLCYTMYSWYLQSAMYVLRILCYHVGMCSMFMFCCCDCLSCRFSCFCRFVFSCLFVHTLRAWSSKQSYTHTNQLFLMHCIFSLASGILSVDKTTTSLSMECNQPTPTIMYSIYLGKIVIICSLFVLDTHAIEHHFVPILFLNF